MSTFTSSGTARRFTTFHEQSRALRTVLKLAVVASTAQRGWNMRKKPILPVTRAISPDREAAEPVPPKPEQAPVEESLFSFHHESREELRKSGAVVHEEVRPHAHPHPGTGPAELPLKEPSHDPAHLPGSEPLMGPASGAQWVKGTPTHNEHPGSS